MRSASAARVASSRISRSPCLLTRDRRTPESKPALACLARTQLSALSLATLSSSALCLAASSCSAFFFFSAKSLSMPLIFGALLAVCAAAALLAGVPGVVLTAPSSFATGATTLAPPGRLRILLSGTLGGGARSLNTLRPSLSSHCHWAMTPVDSSTVTRSTIGRKVGFMGVKFMSGNAGCGVLRVLTRQLALPRQPKR